MSRHYHVHWPSGLWHHRERRDDDGRRWFERLPVAICGEEGYGLTKWADAPEDIRCPKCSAAYWEADVRFFAAERGIAIELEKLPLPEGASGYRSVYLLKIGGEPYAYIQAMAGFGRGWKWNREPPTRAWRDESRGKNDETNNFYEFESRWLAARDIVRRAVELPETDRKHIPSLARRAALMEERRARIAEQRRIDDAEREERRKRREEQAALDAAAAEERAEENRRRLRAMLGSLPSDLEGDAAAGRRLVEAMLQQGRDYLRDFDL